MLGKIKRLMVKKKKFIIFGSGSAGLQLIKYLESKDKVGYFIDNDSRKWGTHIENYIIESPEKLNAENPDDILILVSSTYYKEISMQLISMGFVENKNFVNGMNIYKVSRITQFLHQKICGVHPYNTIFSFNYLNVSRVIKDIKENASLFKGTLVDIGAGKSPYYDLFDVEEYIATDLAGSLPNNESRKITQIIGDALQLPLEDGSCDCAVSMQVLEHISDTNKAISEMNRVLKQNGLVLISVPHISPIHLEPYDFFRFTPIGISRVLQDNGFEVLHLNQQGGLFSSLALTFNMDIVISKYIEGNYRFIPSLSKMVCFSPIIAMVNSLGLLLDRFYKSYRSPTNLFVIARKK